MEARMEESFCSGGLGFAHGDRVLSLLRGLCVRCSAFPAGCCPAGTLRTVTLFAVAPQDTTLQRTGHTHTEQRLLAGIFHPHRNLRSTPEQPGV